MEAQETLLQRAEKRLTLHELVRLGLGRQEDLRLLRNVALQAGELPASSCQQLLREAALREEWRTAREQALLARLHSSGLAALSAADGQLLAEQLGAIMQLQEEQQRAAAMRPRGGSVGAVRAVGGWGPSVSPRTPPPPRPAAVGGSMAAGRRSGGGGGSSGGGSGSSSAALRMYMPKQQQQPGSPHATAAAARGAPASAYPAAGLSPSRRRAAGPHPLLTRSASAGAAGRQPATGGSSGRQPGGLPHLHAPRGRPVHNSQHADAPPVRALAQGHGQPPTGAAVVPGASTANGSPGSRPHSAPEEAAGQQQQHPAAGADAGGGWAGAAQPQSRFRKLLKLQQLLLQGLQEHMALDGSSGAHDALLGSVREAQAYFQECLAEASAMTNGSSSGGGAAGAAWPGQGQGQQQRPGGGAAAPPAWDRMLRLGQLGLTRADIARLDALRQAQAARSIQRAARRWLARRRHQRKLRAAKARADAMQHKLRERAAVIIQAAWRGYAARRHAAALRRAQAQRRAARRIVDARERLAALRIQRAWRQHRKRRRYRQALRQAQAQQQQQRWQAEAGEGADGGAGTAGSASAPAGGFGAGMAAGELQRRVAAVVVIQAYARGWQARRSSDQWWARALHGLRQRRARVAAWQQHQRAMAASYDVQAQLLGSVLQEAQVASAALRDQRREAEELEAAFGAWLLEQQRVALSQPLPKAWVPHPDAATGRMCFLNTRTGELHALHPAVAELAAHAKSQRDAAQQGMAARAAAVQRYLDQLRDATAGQQAIALRTVAVLRQQAAQQAQRRGPPSAPRDRAGGSGGGGAAPAAMRRPGSGQRSGSGGGQAASGRCS